MDVTLALGGGGVRGMAHIGVVRKLIEKGVKIRAIAGTSAGGLIGGLFAAGFSPDEIERAMRYLNQKRPLARGKEAGPSFLGVTGVEQILQDMVGDRKIEGLQIPFAATAVNIATGKEVIISSGRLVEAILATISVPGIFPAREHMGGLLVDGGVVDPVPVLVARYFNPALPVIGVQINRKEIAYDESTIPMVPLTGPSFLWDNFVKNQYVQALKIFAHTVELTSEYLSDVQIAVQKPEIIIHPDVGSMGLLDPMEPDALMAAGEKAAEKAIKKIKRQTSFPASVWRRIKRVLKPTQVPEIWENTPVMR